MFASYKQIADIDLSAYYWTPIGDYDYNDLYYFAGNYDGGGYNISGLFIDGSYANFQGLFGYIKCDSDSDVIYIKNINIINSEIEGYNNVGAVAGYMSGFIGECYIENCHNYGNVFGDSGVCVGGILGEASSTSVSIRNCTNRGNVDGYDNVGGISGTTGTIENCFNYGNVTSHYNYYDEYSCVGGISGCDGNVKNCYNSGKIDGYYAGGIVGEADVYNLISECWNAGHVRGEGYVGGVLGYGHYGTGSVTNCYNTGEIYSSNSRSGGIVGFTDAYIPEAYYADGGVIDYCYNLGKVGNAGICGYMGNDSSYADSYICNCFNFGEAYYGLVAYMDPPSPNAHGSEGHNYLYNSYVDKNLNIPIYNEADRGEKIDCGTCTEEQAKSVEWYTNRDNWYLGAWDFDTVWTIVPGVNDGFPILRNMASYITYISNYGENETVTQNSPAGESVVIAGDDLFEREGYTISSWNTMADGSGDSFTPGFTFEGGVSLTLYAQWERMSYTVTFDANGGGGTMSSVEKIYNEDLVLPANEFTKTGYNFKGWATSANGSVVYQNGAIYTINADITLYAVWEAKVIPVSLDWNGGDGGTSTTSTIYLKYNSGWYSSSSCTSSSSITSITKPTRTGFTFNGYNTVLNGTGTTLIDSTGKITASNTFYSTDSTKTIYAQWVANNPAKYDSEGGYWYVENGMMPQEKVTDSTLISNINSSSTIGSTYYFAGLSLQSKVCDEKEYCQYNGNWYEVMPIKWRLVYSSSQTSGYGTETATLAVMAEIVYADAFSENYIGANAGYSSESVTEFKKNQIDETFLVTETKSMLTFGSTTINGTPTSVSSNIFVASTDDLSSFTTSANGTEKRGSVKFSDLVKDYLQANGKNAFYYTRDLGTNYNNIFCLNSNGDGVQYKANNIFGVQFTIKVSEYACVG